jgi:4-alpha-glucanotransferase
MNDPRPPVRFLFGLHLHQPVGNFDHVFESHVEDVYRPLLHQLKRRELKPVLLHVSGPLLEWFETHDRRMLDEIGRSVADGAIEPLLAGMYEPILASIPRADRVEQIAWHRDKIRSLFGVEARGLWLTERVWEPELAADLADAGVEYVFVDDRHFLVSGYSRDELHVPFRTESDGKAVSVLAIDERLRYLIPFHDPSDVAELLRSLRDEGAPLAIYADDGEKFGGWPGTKALVYGRGWFDRFCDTIDGLRAEGVVELVTGADAIRTTSARGPAYLPTASYLEMETWALPADAARRLTAVERDLGAERMAGPDRAFIRGAHWRNFLSRYSESNRLQKKAAALSRLCRDRGDPPAARRAIGRAQCNDAYWHGVFGGLYLPHLRSALWYQLAEAEGVLRKGEPLEAEILDIDHDGQDEVWIHSDRFSALVAPSRGGAIVELTSFANGVNYADTLTRRREAYHMPPIASGHAEPSGAHLPSIHELEASFSTASPPPVDLDDRAIGVARIIQPSVDEAGYAAASYEPVRSWAAARCSVEVERAAACVVVRCAADDFSVTWSFSSHGAVEGVWNWDGSSFDQGDRLALELSLGTPMQIDSPSAFDTWRYPIETHAKSERGMEHVRQGESVTALFDARAGQARISLNVV